MTQGFTHIRLRSFFAWMLLGSLLIYVPAVLLADAGLLEESTFFMLSDWLVFFLFPLLWLYIKARRQSLELFSFYTKPEPFPWRLVLLVTVMAMLFSAGISIVQVSLLSSLIPDWWLTALGDSDVIDESTAGTVLSSTLSACVLAPIMEETIFRGFFLQRMSHKWGLKRAILVSSILFGFAHADVIGAAVFGVLMCLLYVKTRSLLVSMAVHALNNTVVSLLLLSEVDSGTEAEVTAFGNTELYIGSGLVLASLLWIAPFIRRQWRYMQKAGLPPVRSVLLEASAPGTYGQVIMTERHMAVELPDHIVQQLQLEEEDYVRLEMDGDRVVLLKAHDRIS